jgi:hypothetical protein
MNLSIPLWAVPVLVLIVAALSELWKAGEREWSWWEGDDQDRPRGRQILALLTWGAVALAILMDVLQTRFP